MKNLFDYLSRKFLKNDREEPSAEAAPPPLPEKPAAEKPRAAIIKPHVDWRIKGLKDHYAFDRQMRPETDFLPLNKKELFMELRDAVIKGRRSLMASGIHPPQVVGVFRCVIVSNRVFTIRAEFNFKDNPDGTFEAHLCPKTVAAHSNLDEKLKAFLN